MCGIQSYMIFSIKKIKKRINLTLHFKGMGCMKSQEEIVEESELEIFKRDKEAIMCSIFKIHKQIQIVPIIL